MERASLTVTELNNRIRDLLDLDPMLADVCVRGELSNYKIYPSGHHYFTLKDSESSLRCVMFKSSASKLRFRPENGMSVTVFGRISVYPRDGTYQLYSSAILPIGTGDLQIAFEQLKARLGSEGLFNPEHKKPLPEFPERIAIITSSAGAAVHDMIRILNHRWPMAKVIILPVRVQGTEAPEEIADALKYANKYNVADLIITGRGGGSVEDLWAFNDERVARAIFASDIPVISAVGHEPDITISDYVADARASTPSNAAEIAVPDRNEIADELSGLELRCTMATNKRLIQLRKRLENISEKRVIRDPMAQIDNRRITTDYLRDRLIFAEECVLGEKKNKYIKLSSALDAMSPLRVLSRGYSFAAGNDGTLIKSVNELNAGDKIELVLMDGTAHCRVEETEQKNKEKKWLLKN